MLRSKRAIAAVVVVSLAALTGLTILVVYGIHRRQAVAIINQVVALAGPTDVTEDVQLDWLPYQPPVPDASDFISIGNYRVYLNTAPDTSIVLRPTSRGMQTFMYLSGPEAASSYDFAFTLLPKTELKKDKNGTIGVLDRQTKRTVRVLKKPWAKSVEGGTSHSTTFSVKGNVVTQTVDLKEATFPVVADPDFDDPLTQLLEGRVPALKEAKTATKDGPSHKLGDYARYYSGPNGLEIRVNNRGTSILVNTLFGISVGEIGELALVAVGTKFGPMIAAAVASTSNKLKPAGSLAGAITADQIDHSALSNLCLGVTLPGHTMNSFIGRYSAILGQRYLDALKPLGPDDAKVWFEHCESYVQADNPPPPPPPPADDLQPEIPAQLEPPAPVEETSSGVPVDYGIDMNQACADTYGTAHAEYLNWDDPNSWVCVDSNGNSFGGLDLDAYCSNLAPGSRAFPTDNTVYGWRCRQ